MTAPGDETRARILETAWEQVRERGTAGRHDRADRRRGRRLAAARLLPLRQPRRPVHRHGAPPRRGERLRRPGRAARAQLAPIEGLEHLAARLVRVPARDPPVARALEAALITGDEGGSAWRDRMDELHEALRIAVDRLARHGHLADGWTVDSAADWAWSRIQPTTWQHLVGERGWTADDYTERTITSLLGELVAQRRRERTPTDGLRRPPGEREPA